MTKDLFKPTATPANPIKKEEKVAVDEAVRYKSKLDEFVHLDHILAIEDSLNNLLRDFRNNGEAKNINNLQLIRDYMTKIKTDAIKYAAKDK